MELKPSLIKFRYHQEPTVQTHYANGIQTASTPDQKIIVRFFTENPPLALSETWKTDRSGQLLEQVELENAPEQIVREILASVKLDPKTARALVQVITTQLDKMGL